MKAERNASSAANAFDLSRHPVSDGEGLGAGDGTADGEGARLVETDGPSALPFDVQAASPRAANRANGTTRFTFDQCEGPATSVATSSRVPGGRSIANRSARTACNS